MKVSLLQLNLTVGDIDGNANKIIEWVRASKNEDVDMCVTSELALLGYPPRDLLLNRDFIKRVREKTVEIAGILSDGPQLLMGAVEENIAAAGKPLYNSAVLIRSGRIAGHFHKTLLPTYDVFDEHRYFQPSSSAGVFDMQGVKIGVTVCEDIWNDKNFWDNQLYNQNPLDELARLKVGCIINLSASPFTVGKQAVREAMLRNIALNYHVPVLYVNQVGGNDDLVFDGRSCAFSASGELIGRAKAFAEDSLIVDHELNNNRISKDDFTLEAEAWGALVLGTRDYAAKCGFKKALVGLSGGIDSALTAVIASRAIGPDNVIGVLMPSPYSSRGSIDDSMELARRLKITTLTMPIPDIMAAFTRALDEAFRGRPIDATEENIQSRIRGNLLMALSNKYKALLLTTGNKSELAVGYCTIYGDMSGGLAVIADVSKTMVYRLARWINRKEGEVIPQEIIAKAPSAELRPNQTDQDTLPPYDILDQILIRHIEQHQSAAEIIENGFEKEVVVKVLDLIKKSEFKRKQAAPGIKITDRAFGVGWRMPIACKKYQ